MTPKLPYHLLFFSIWCSLLLQSCAEQGVLLGGPIDKKPPQLDSRRYSSPNYQTNFREREIILTFDEWVQLKDANNQILVSPPMKERPDVKIKQKSVILTFKEDLLPNTTYTIQFGESIVDFTEGNPVEDLRFIFSTGDAIDSLQLKGEIVDALSGQPMSKVWVMLYDNLQDSAPIAERPLYVTKTNEQGQFQLENLRQDSFRIFALKDNNANYRYDQAGESIAFWPDIFVLNDSTKAEFRLRMFSPDEKLTIASSTAIGRGQWRIEFNQDIANDSIVIEPKLSRDFKLKERGQLSPPSLRPRPLSPKGSQWEAEKTPPIEKQIISLPAPIKQEFRYFIEKEKEAIVLWWVGQDSDFELLLSSPMRNWSQTLNLKIEDADTLPHWSFAAPTAPTSAKGKSQMANKSAQMVETQNLLPQKPVLLRFSRPLQDIDTSKVFCRDTLGNLLNFDFFFNPDTAPLSLGLGIEMPAAMPLCTLFIMPDAIGDIWGERNRDTLIRVFKQLAEDELANLSIKITNADSSMRYIIKVMEGEKIFDMQLMQDTNALTLEYKGLEPRTFTVKVIHDANKDGRWTNGNYEEKRQAERITLSTPLNLRKGWDNELEVDLNTVERAKTKKGTKTGNAEQASGTKGKGTKKE